MKKASSCKEATELPGWISSLIGQKNIFLANQRDGIRRLLEPWVAFAGPLQRSKLSLENIARQKISFRSG